MYTGGGRPLVKVDFRREGSMKFGTMIVAAALCVAASVSESNGAEIEIGACWVDEFGFLNVYANVSEAEIGNTVLLMVDGEVVNGGTLGAGLPAPQNGNAFFLDVSVFPWGIAGPIPSEPVTVTVMVVDGDDITTDTVIVPTVSTPDTFWGTIDLP